MNIEINTQPGFQVQVDTRTEILPEAHHSDAAIIGIFVCVAHGDQTIFANEDTLANTLRSELSPLSGDESLLGSLSSLSTQLARKIAIKARATSQGTSGQSAIGMDSCVTASAHHEQLVLEAVVLQKLVAVW